ncbi:hypothetical protein GH5_08329 [Leishmania sp. Ghana 2012 LV757]|uniref:hypothetical protein n=1 Tax=Leishmania sp. Ghana 2012 LV757 TaxID=2803181 RepID=UPI001B4AB9EC|nr:hypothetical protein GH5_08329 [Leishmania sp. Ghana 2012 LV757]
MTSVTVFDDAQANATVTKVSDGLRMLNESGCDSIIGLGGGSPQDAAKGIALVKTNGGQMKDMEGADRASKPQFPMIAVSTTAGTASEMTRFAVITDEVRRVKMVITTDMCTPLVAGGGDDAELMPKMPKALTAATGMDALTHAVEAYVPVGVSLITDACALQAMRLSKQHLARASHHGSDVVASKGMCYAELLAGMAFNSAGLGYVHAMAQQMGAAYNLPHGVCNAILLPHVEEYNKAVVTRPPRSTRSARCLRRWRFRRGSSRLSRRKRSCRALRMPRYWTCARCSIRASAHATISSACTATRCRSRTRVSRSSSP